MSRIKIVLILLCMFYGKTVFSQKFTDNLQIETKGQYGFILPHHSFFYYFTEHHPYAFNIEVSKRLTGKKEWQQLYRYPIFGYGIYYCELGNKQYFGQVGAAYGFINIPIITKPKFSFNYNIAGGFSYLTKSFDVYDNYYNLAIGSPGNVYVNLAFDTKFKLSEHFIFETGIGITHYSNGAVAKPNTGINVVTAQSGIIYNFNTTNYTKTEIQSHVPYFEYSVIYGAGIRENSPPVGKKWFASSFSINAERAFWRKRKFGIGFDVFYDNSIYSELESSDSLADNSKMDNFRNGIHFSHDLIIGKTSITMQTGTYIIAKYRREGNIYSRFGIKHKINEHWFANLSLKTHFAKADYIEWGLGYCFRK